MSKTRLATPSPKQLTHTNLTYVLLFGLSMLVGCTQMPKGRDISHQAPVYSSKQAQHSSASVFAYEFPKLPPEEQRKIASSLNQASASDVQAKLQLAIAYGLPNSRVRDSAKAQQLLEELLAHKSLGIEDLAIVSVMHEYMAELNRSGQKAREEQKRADSAQQKLDELQKKLDDLKNIEKTMVDRDQGVRK